MPRYSTVVKDVKKFPFHLIYEAFQQGRERETKAAEAEYNKFIASKEQEWADTHEAPYEGNFSDEYSISSFMPSTAKLMAAGYKEVELAIESLAVKNNSPWLLPQLSALLNETVKLVKNDSGLFDARETFLQWANKHPVKLGIIVLLTFPRRGAIVKVQNNTDGLPFAAPVPLLLSPFKQYRNVNYMEWDRNSLFGFVDEKLLDVMLLDKIPEISKERLLEIRELGLTTISTGVKKSPTSTFKLYGIGDTELGGYGDLLPAMLTQIWVFSPGYRNRYMILDPLNWDNEPEPLLDLDIFSPSPKDSKIIAPKPDLNMPW